MKIRRRLTLAFGMALAAATGIGAVPAYSATDPVVSITPDVSAQWFRSGTVPITVTASHPSGIVLVRLTSVPGGDLAEVHDCPTFAACPTRSTPLTHVFRPAEMTDGVLTVLARIFMGDGTRFERPFVIRVDHTAPEPPRGVSLAGGDRWRNQNRFDVSWVNPKFDGLTPVIAVHYRVCPAEDEKASLARCVSGVRRQAGVERISDLAVPGTGAWRVWLALEDAAGNVDFESAAIVTDFKLDQEPPAINVDAPDPVDPARIAFRVTDGASGVAMVEVEARRQGDSHWTAVPTSGGDAGFVATLDDEKLPAGLYDVRLRATDRVGNERTVVDVARPPIALPTREASTVTAGLVKRDGKRRVRVMKAVLNHGSVTVIEGVVGNALNVARPGASVEISERIDSPGSSWARIATVAANDKGRFRYRTPSGTSRTLRFTYPGTPTTRPAAAEVVLQVRAGITFKTSARRLRNGESVVLRGQLLGRPLPEDGKLVALQALTDKGWTTFATARARASDGRWSYRYRFTQTSVTARYSFRVVVPRETGYPFAKGQSPVRKVVVRGGG